MTMAQQARHEQARSIEARRQAETDRRPADIVSSAPSDLRALRRGDAANVRVRGTWYAGTVDNRGSSLTSAWVVVEYRSRQGRLDFAWVQINDDYNPRLSVDYS